jgi:hypothetical protein
MFGDEGSTRSKDAPSQPLVDDIKNLFIGQIRQAKGTIQTDVDKLSAIFQGEVLIYGHAEGDIFIIERMRRVVIYGWAIDQQADPRIGVLSLAGRSTESKLNRGLGEGAIEELALLLHYAALTNKLPPLYESDDAMFPQVEQALGRLTWEQEGPADDHTVQLELTFDFGTLVDKKLGIVQGVSFDRITVPFNRAGTGAPRPKPHFSLQSNCPTSTAPCGEETQTRVLPIKFVSFSELRTLAEVEAICQNQINGVCEVWRNKAALDLSVQATIDEGTEDQKADFSAPDRTQESSLDLTGFASGDSIEVYVVDELVNRSGGGMAYGCGWGGAYCILDLNVATANPRLLAHELGHIIGLDHPGSSACYPGSSGSIMEPTGTGGGVIVPNPDINTRFNCRIFTDLPEPLSGALNDPCLISLNPIITTTATTDCFRPDA